MPVQHPPGGAAPYSGAQPQYGSPPQHGAVNAAMGGLSLSGTGGGGDVEAMSDDALQDYIRQRNPQADVGCQKNRVPQPTWPPGTRWLTHL